MSEDDGERDALSERFPDPLDNSRPWLLPSAEGLRQPAELTAQFKRVLMVLSWAFEAKNEKLFADAHELARELMAVATAEIQRAQGKSASE